MEVTNEARDLASFGRHIATQKQVTVKQSQMTGGKTMMYYRKGKIATPTRSWLG